MSTSLCIVLRKHIYFSIPAILVTLSQDKTVLHVIIINKIIYNFLALLVQELYLIAHRVMELIDQPRLARVISGIIIIAKSVQYALISAQTALPRRYVLLVRMPK